MKTLIIILLFLSSTTFGQRATIDNDTAKYDGKSYAVGDTVHLGYGSKDNKGFAFIQIGTLIGGTSDLQKNWSKADAIIDKVYKKGKQVFLRAKLPEAAGNKLFIDLEAAVDNKEIKAL